MEFESGSELERAQRPNERAEMSPTEAWGQAWLDAWPWAKTVAKAIEKEARESAQPWANLWTRAEVDAHVRLQAGLRERLQARGQAQADLWRGYVVGQVGLNSLSKLNATKEERAAQDAQAEARARAGEHAGARVIVREQVRAQTQALQLAGVWAKARGEARAVGERPPSNSAATDLSAIRDILSSLNRNGIANRLWYHSRKTRDEYSSIINFIAPITRLPFELLRQIFLIIIDEASGPPSTLMLACKYWHTIVTSIWSSINLGTMTPMDAVTRKLERNQWLLDIVVDTDSDRGDLIPSDGAFGAIFAVIEASSRWRSVVVKSFPGQAELPDDLVNRQLQRCPNDTMSRFTTFKIMSACETSPLLNGLLHILGTTAGPELTTMEINSPNVISFLAPAYPSIFNFLRVLSLDTRGIPNPVDLLPYLHRLETFTASHISFPIYNDDVELPFIHTLRHLRLRAASIQWMSGRTFHVLEDCTLIFPLRRHVLPTFNTTLPNCKRMTFQGSPLNILSNISAQKLIHLSVTCSGSFNKRGNQQLIQLSRWVFEESCLALKILHVSIEATNKAWISALSLMLDLEELVIESAGPSSLGVKVIQALIIRPVHASNPDATPALEEWHEPLCPSLKRFGLKYRRWLRRSEQFNLIPDFKSVISSRERSNYPLQRFSIWTTSNQVHPLELIEGSQISQAGLQRLVDEISEILSWIPYEEGVLHGGGTEMYWEGNDYTEQAVLGEQFTTLDSGDDDDLGDDDDSSDDDDSGENNDSKGIRFRPWYSR